MEQGVHPGVAEYYTGKNVFITGGTGFIGKVLIEKLLRSCPRIGKLFILIRPKKSQDIHRRITELTQCRVFDKLRKEQPNFADKLHPINGDMMCPDLGMNMQDVVLLEEQIHIVFHSAATIKFDEPLRFAVEMNVLGIRKMIKLCRNFRHLEVFVHVSTAYANCDRSFIEEVIYPPPVEPQKLIDSLDWMDDDMLNMITQNLIGDKPNTYTYTKQLGEHLLLKEGGDLPLAILRPSIVGAAWEEPYQGWIDNYNGPGGCIVAIGKGIMRTMLIDNLTVADIIPVDFPVNMMIAVAWYTAVLRPKKVLIYHSTSGTVNPCTWGEVVKEVLGYWKKVPLDSCFRRPGFDTRTNSFLNKFWLMVSHMIPAYLADFGFYLMGKRPRMVKVYKKLHRSMDTLTFFTMRSWKWSYTNMDMLLSHLSQEDKKTFYFDPRPLHWPSYVENCCLGLKKFLLNEDLSDVPAARTHLRNLRNIRYAFNTILVVALWRALISRSQIAGNLWRLIISLVIKFVKYFRITSSIRR